MPLNLLTFFPYDSNILSPKLEYAIIYR